MGAKVSILLPVYEQDQWLAESIVSCLRQTEPDFELIIVDDASQDDSYEIAKFYASLDDRIQVHQLKERGGQATATNYAAQFATGKYLAWHHADDNYVPEFLEWSLAETEKGAEVVFGAYQFIDIYGKLGITPYDLVSLKWNRGDFKKQCYLSCCTMIYTRVAYDEVGGYDNTFRASVDWDFSLRVTRDRPVSVVPKVLVYYREHHLRSNRVRIPEGIREQDRARVRAGDYG